MTIIIINIIKTLTPFMDLSKLFIVYNVITSKIQWAAVAYIVYILLRHFYPLYMIFSIIISVPIVSHGKKKQNKKKNELQVRLVLYSKYMQSCFKMLTYQL